MGFVFEWELFQGSQYDLLHTNANGDGFRTYIPNTDENGDGFRTYIPNTDKNGEGFRT